LHDLNVLNLVVNECIEDHADCVFKEKYSDTLANEDNSFRNQIC